MKPDPQLRVEVEPLGDARWARIERDLFAKLDERPLPVQMPAAREPVRRRTFAWSAAAAVAVAAAVVVAIVSSHAMRPDRVSLTTTESTSEFTVGESALTVAPRSLVMVSGDDDHGIDVVLDRGTVTCAVAPRNGRPPFRLNAGGVRIRVVGTKFTVTREGGQTSVDVEHGSVEVAARGVVTMLHDGEHWPTAGAGAAGTESSSSSLGSKDTSAPAAGRQAARGARSRRSLIDDAFPMPDLSASEPEALETSAPPPATAPVAQPPTPPAAPAPPSVDPSQQAYEAASRRERSNPAEAESLYRQIVSSGTGWAPNALFALGRLEAYRGHRAEAARLLNSYLLRYPHGINVDDARELLRSMR